MEQLVQMLGREEAAADLVGRCFDFVLDQPVARFVRPESFLEHVDRTLSEPITRRVIREHVRKLVDRELERARERGDRAGDWLTEEATTVLRELAGQPIHLDKRLLEKAVEQEVVRKALRAVVQETLDHFVKSLSSAGQGGGLLGALGRGAVGFGRGLLKGLGSQLEGQLKRAARSFVDGSMTLLRARLVAYLSRPETAEQIGRMNRSAFDSAMELETVRILQALLRAPIDDLLELVPGLIVHNLGRAPIRQAILEELRAALEVEGERTLRELLEDADAVEAWRSEAIHLAAPLLTEFATSTAFEGWLGEYAPE